MEQAELHFRKLDLVAARESFLEEQMLQSEVHHLEVRTGFFDKLAVLSAGSLALGITLLGSQYEHATLRAAVEKHLVWFSAALLLVLLSLVACVLTNFFISNAVAALSKQIEFVYKSAHELTQYMKVPGFDPEFAKSANDRIGKHEKSARDFQDVKDRTVQISTYTGIVAVLFLMLGYAVGFSWIIAVYSHSPVQSISQPVGGGDRNPPKTSSTTSPNPNPHGQK